MRNVITALSLLATSTLAALDLRQAIRPTVAGLEKRQITLQCSVWPGFGACQQAAAKCEWGVPSEYNLCHQTDDGNYVCFNPSQGDTCCADGTVAPAGSSCYGATVASASWHVFQSSTPYAEPFSSEKYTPYSSSSYGGNMYPSYPTQDSSSQGYAPVGTGPPGWPSPTRTLYNYGGSQSSSTYVGLSAGATAGPRYGVDAAGLALIAAGAILM